MKSLEPDPYKQKAPTRKIENIEELPTARLTSDGEQQTNDQDKTLADIAEQISLAESAILQEIEEVKKGRKRKEILESGKVFQGKYKVIKMIGSGGMGQVYVANHIALGSKVAIKVLNTTFIGDEEEATDRFKREAKATAAIDHPNAVKVFDFGVEDNVCYLVMEYLNGESLRKRLTRLKQFSIPEALNLIQQVCSVLEAMHHKGIVHRDLKPDNIFFHNQEDREVVKVLDFGIAKVSGSTLSEGKLTSTGALLGTPHYMSPEQCQGMKLDGRSDLYSFGVILYELLCGSLPFEAENTLSMLFKHVRDNPINIKQVMPELPQSIADVVMKLLEKQPKNRYQSAKEFAQVFSETVQSNPITRNTNSISTEKIVYVDVPRPQNIVVENVAPSTNPFVKYAVSSIAIVLIFSIFGIWKMSSSEVNIVNSSSPTPIDTAKKLSEKEILLKENFVLIPATSATIGTNGKKCDYIPGCTVEDFEKPAHGVNLEAYYIGKYEVTNADYYEFIKATNYNVPTNWDKETKSFSDGAAKLPVNQISWDDVVAYCKWRKEKEKIDFRLPSEAEWEYAARGNSEALFPWGDDWDSSFVYGAKPADRIKNPASIDVPPNNSSDRSPFGIFAMAGNVAEWTSSSFNAYPNSAYEKKVTEKDQECRVVKGGSFNAEPTYLRVTSRAWYEVTKKDSNIGFRLAVTAKESN